MQNVAFESMTLRWGYPGEPFPEIGLLAQRVDVCWGRQPLAAGTAEITVGRLVGPELIVMTFLDLCDIRRDMMIRLEPIPPTGSVPWFTFLNCHTAARGVTVASGGLSDFAICDAPRFYGQGPATAVGITKAAIRRRTARG